METFEQGQIGPQSVLRLFQDAYLDCALDEDGEILVREAGLKVYVTFQRENEGVVMRASFGMIEASSRAQRLLFANRINEEYVMVRACVREETFVLDYVLRTEGGASKRAVIYALRLFARIGVAVWEEGRENDAVLA